MSNLSRLLALTGVLLFSLCTASIVSAAYVDPPGRVARLSHVQGTASYSPAGEDEWFSVVRNRPLIRGDRLWTDRDSRAELQVGSAAVRLGSNTSVEILDLDDRIAQIKMTQGTLNLRVRRMYPGQILEVATPTLAFTINRAGRYRVDVDRRNAVTTIAVWKGAGEAYGENTSFPLRAGDMVRFYDADLRDYEIYGLPLEDDFDRYSLERDRRLDLSASLRYLDDDVVGYADLDEYGSWRPVSSYGTVWFPSRVSADWAPYRDGHWIWQEPWGWTWVDDAPWGFAPSHYGRWIYVSNRWGWIPGRRHVRPIYAPALVAFIGGRGWSLSFSFGGGSPIGWFPLGPREVYVPSYQASRDYFTQVNVNNTVINNTIITNVYNNYSSGTVNVDQVKYVNRTVAGAVTAVPSTVFVNAQPVRSAAIRLDRKAVTTGEITRLAPIAPSVRSVTGSGKAVGVRPSREAIDRRVFVRNTPPPEERPFAAREQLLQKNPGRAPDPSAVRSVQGRDDKSEQNVRVIGEQRGAVDARAAGSSRNGAKPGTPAAAPGQLRQRDRSDESAPEKDDRNRDKEPKGQGAVQPRAVEQQAERQRQVEQQQQEQRQRKAASEQKAAEQQQVERQRQAEQQQQEQRQRKAASEQKAAEQQQVERQRQAEQQQQEQRQRKAASEQKAAEQQQAERQRQAEQQQQEQRQRKAASEQRAAEQQQAERQRQVEQQQQEQRQRKAASEQRAAEQQQAERLRQIEAQQQAERQSKAASEQRAAEQRAAERKAAEQKAAEQKAAEKKAAEQSGKEPQGKEPDERQRRGRNLPEDDNPGRGRR